MRVDAYSSLQERLDNLLKAGFSSLDADIPFDRLFNHGRLQRYQDAISGYYQIPLSFISDMGEKVTERSGLPELSGTLSSLDGNNSRHFSETYDAVLLSGVKRQVSYMKCPRSGLSLAAIPVFVENRHVGSWIAGPVRCEDFSMDSIESTIRSHPAHEESLIRGLASVRNISLGGFEDFCTEMTRVSNDISLQSLYVSHSISLHDHIHQADKKFDLLKSQQDITSYCFELYSHEGSVAEKLDLFLKYIGKRLRFSRAYIYEKLPYGKFCITREWCDEGIFPVPWEFRILADTEYTNRQLVIYDELEISKGNENAFFRGTGARSSVHLPIFYAGQLIAVLVLDECVLMRIYLQDEKDRLNALLQTAANLILRGRAWSRLIGSKNTSELLHGGVSETVNGLLNDLEKKREEYHSLIDPRTGIDDMTGLPNIHRFQESLEAAVTDTSQGALLLMNLDDFKNINSVHGIDSGDAVISVIASYFLRHVEADRRVFRIYGDEFAILLENVGEDTVHRTVEQMWNRFQTPWFIDGYSFDITFSMGVARFPHDGCSAGFIWRAANLAMLASKKRDKNSVCFYHEALSAPLEHRMNLEKHLDMAVQADFAPFRVYYQPVMDIQNDRVFGAEALLRWKNEEGAFISPAEFLPIAESMGLMNRIGLWVLKTALRDLKPWTKDGLQISVNLSMSQLQYDSFLDDVMAALDEADIAPETLLIEVSESMAAYDVQFSNSQLNLLRLNGVRVGLDNYGTEHSDLTKLPNMPYDTTNIDMMYVRNMQHDEFCDAVVRTFIELAKAAEYTVCAEGVEFQEQYLDLKEYGCDFAQGYYFAPALTIEAFSDFMKNRA